MTGDLRLRPMREDEFAPWAAFVTEDYGRETARNKKISEETALDQAKASMEALLPQGLATPMHEVEIAEELDDRVGHLWYAREPRGDRDIVWLYDIYVEETHRGRGVGRRLMELFEERVRAQGIGRIALNVYADNARARSLYESLGYQETARQLYKDLDATGGPPK